MVVEKINILINNIRRMGSSDTIGGFMIMIIGIGFLIGGPGVTKLAVGIPLLIIGLLTMFNWFGMLKGGVSKKKTKYIK
jgi:hypothetical protein